MKILQEEREMKEKMTYKREVQKPRKGKKSKDGMLPSEASSQTVHDIYKKISRTCEKAKLKERNESNKKNETSFVSGHSDRRRVNQRLINAHRAYSATERQTDIISTWSQPDAASQEYREEIGMPDRALLNYYSSSPDMLTMSDIPKIMAEYKFLVKACAVLSEKS